LRQLVDARAAKELAKSRYPGIVAQLVVSQPFLLRFRVVAQQARKPLFSVDHHGSKFETVEAVAAKSDAPMSKNDRAAFKRKNDNDDQEEWRNEYERHNGDRDIEAPNNRLIDIPFANRRQAASCSLPWLSDRNH
jgi:hypothetical protein